MNIEKVFLKLILISIFNLLLMLTFAGGIILAFYFVITHVSQSLITILAS